MNMMKSTGNQVNERILWNFVIEKFQYIIPKRKRLVVFWVLNNMYIVFFLGSSNGQFKLPLSLISINQHLLNKRTT
jgi:hypothetical protein